MLFRETIAAYSENYTKHKYSLRHSAEPVNDESVLGAKCLRAWATSQ